MVQDLAQVADWGLISRLPLFLRILGLLPEVDERLDGMDGSKGLEGFAVDHLVRQAGEPTPSGPAHLKPLGLPRVGVHFTPSGTPGRVIVDPGVENGVFCPVPN